MPNPAVFLSYASQDAEAALRLGTALRVAGVEVWIDQEGGLVGGDTWDRKIRDQINTCALFIPLISANTQARHEGYFRLEWKLAEDRSHLIAKGKPFIVPVSIDGTTERGALVPDAFLAVQWTRIGSADSLPAFCERVKKLLGREVAGATSLPAGRPPYQAQGQLAAGSSGVSLSEVVHPMAVPSVLEGAFETFVPQRSRWRRALPVAAALGIGVLLTAAVAWRLWPVPVRAPAPVSQFSYRLPEGQRFGTLYRNVIAVSPDGRRFVYTTVGGLFLRSLDELEARIIPGTEGATTNPFFSPDGQSVGYWQTGQLKRIAIGGGAPVVIGAINPSGATWASDGTILVDQSEGILRVSAAGGTPAVVIAAENGSMLSMPQLLPDGDTVLLTERIAMTGSNDRTRIVAHKISTNERKVLVEDGVDARYLPTGHLVYVAGNVMMGVAFDARRLAVTGGAVPLVQGFRRSIFYSTANYGVGSDGTLVWAYSATFAGDSARQLALSDRAGKLTPLALPPGHYDAPRVSPDGTRVAVGVADAKEAYIAIYDLDGKTALRRLTFGGNSWYPVWSRDGQRVAFQSDREGDRAIFWQRADGTGAAERLTKPEKEAAHVPASWSPNDETLLFAVVPSDRLGATGALWTYTRASGTAAPFGNVKQAAQSPMFSPDGRWVAYGARASNAEFELYIQPFPATGAQYQLPRLAADLASAYPMWSPDGTEILFSPSASQFAAVAVTTEPTVAFGNPTSVPRTLMAKIGGPIVPRPFDLMPDGRLIGLVTPGEAEETGPQEIRIILNWFEEVKRLVPVK